MSLNGLDDPKVAQAYDASTEPGAWFVLKYATRDEIDLLDSGSGGLPELRKTVESYEETSPLFGFLRYRRRVVIIRYVPEGCSRLIQARVTVHFNAVCERFSPYDTTFEITEAQELRDSKLSAACSLHAASASNASSSSSNRRRRLNEIAEEEDEDDLPQRAAKRQSLTLNSDGLAADTPLSSPEPAVTLNSDLATSPDETKFSAASTSDIPQFVGAEPWPTSPSQDAEAPRRMSTQSGRHESMNYAYYPYSKPKIKLGPRPSLDVGARPQTAGNFRPVSSIPAGLKMFGTKGTKKSGSSKNKDVDDMPSPGDDDPLPASVPIPEEPQRATYFETVRPSTSSGVTLPPKSPSAMSTATIKPGMTPEKARLMKAKKMREKKKAQAQPPVPAIPAFKDSAPTAADETAEVTTDEIRTEPNPQDDTNRAVRNETYEVDSTAEKRVTMIKADSAIAIDATSAATASTTDEASDLTQSDSRPTSPIVVPSEADQSTRASSISESTQEATETEIKDTSDEDNVTPQESEKEQELVTPADPQTVEDVASSSPEELTNAETEVPAEEDAQTQPHIAHEMPDGSETVGTDAVSEKTEDPEPMVLAPVSKFSVKTNSSSRDVVEKAAETDEGLTTNPEPTTVETAEIKPPRTPPSDLKRQFSVSKKDLRDATKAAASPSALTEGPTVLIDESAVEEAEGEAQSGDEHSEAETISASTKPKRKFNVEPIRTDLPSRPHSRTETDFADDESLLNELQSATVEEAKPMTVAKTPLSPGFPSPFSATTPPPANAATSQPPKSGHSVRTVSNPVRGSFVMPPSDVSQSSARSMSGGAAYLHKITQQQQAGANLAKKTNMGSSISKRIKALEMLSVETKDPGLTPTSRERPSSTFFSVKKGRTPSRSPSVLERATSFNMKPETPSTPQSREVSPEAEKQLSRRQRERSGSVASRLSMFEPPAGAPPSAQHSPHNSPRGRPESISVTAKIIRDPDSSLDAPKDPSQIGHLDLKQSPLVVDHQRAEPAPAAGPAEAMAALLGNKDSMQDRRISRESIRSQSHERGKSSTSRRSSLSVVKGFIKERRRSITSSNNDAAASSTNLPSGAKSPTRPPSVHQTSTISSRLSFSSHRSSFSKDRELGVTSPVPPETPTFDVPSDEVKSLSSDKRRSRAGRIMRRLSNLGSRGKISTPAGLAATVTEEEIVSEVPPPRPATTATSTAPDIVSYMGDVNVQFPDNLLWKRRNLCLDAAGYILLSIAAQQQTTRAGAVQGTKRYHLSDFRRPYAPDVEVQELPNSVVLDFMEGSGLQFACEDRVGQANVLHILQDAHAKHALMFQM
ncbi:hypothetical protein LIA77_00245 [Sarocladium implicatum]|nr:hypothetical protein LIA77_00245 [Sarocladium implicatum]